MATCTQCDKPAIGGYDGNALCLSCLERVSNIVHQQNEQRHREILYSMHLANVAERHMDAVVGLGNSTPPFDMSLFQPSRNVKVNNINVSNSVLGAISTEEVGSINVSLKNVMSRGETELAQKLLDFTHHVLQSNEIEVQVKNEMLEQISLLSEQMAAPKEGRKLGLMKAAIATIGTTAGTISSIASAWKAVKDLLPLP